MARTKNKKRKTMSHHHRDDQDQQIDRASNLPDHVLHHILSFLDTKSMVQTGLLSRRWRFLWRDVGVLNFDRCSFATAEGFTEHVRKLLSNSTAAVSDLSLDFGARPRSSWGGVIATPRYCVSTNYVDDDGLSMVRTIETAATLINYGSLKTLKLKAALLIKRAFPLGGFEFVTNLELHECRFYFPNDTRFADLPCLKYLKLHDCSTSYDHGLLKVSGSQLLDLDVRIWNCSIPGIEVSAPELKSFRFQGRIEQLVQLNLPSLDKANIRLEWEAFRDRGCEFMNLLRGLRNATSLDLSFDKSISGMHWRPCHFPLTGIEGLMKSSDDEGSPFTRLKRLRVQYPQEPPSIPRRVLRYFFGSSPGSKTVKLEWHS